MVYVMSSLFLGISTLLVLAMLMQMAEEQKSAAPPCAVSGRCGRNRVADQRAAPRLTLARPRRLLKITHQDQPLPGTRSASLHPACAHRT